MSNCFNSKKGKVFCIVSWLVMKSGYTMITLNIEDHGISLAMHRHWQQNWISMAWSWWDQPGVVNYELLKPTKTITGDHYQLQLMCLSCASKKNTCYMTRDMTEFCNMTMLGHMLPNGWNPTWKCLKRKSYPICRIHQTLPHLITTCSNRWNMAWLNSPFILMKMPKNGLTCGWPQKTCCFSN